MAFGSNNGGKYKKYLIIGLINLTLQFILNLTLCASQPQQLSSKNDSIILQVQQQLSVFEHSEKLNFPKTVKRFYKLIENHPNWLRPEDRISPTISAMLLLDCVRQFGLKRENYHPGILSYENMYKALKPEQHSDPLPRVQFEIMLTDALISIINNLHYGAFNPNLPQSKIDNGVAGGLNAEIFLLQIKDSAVLMDSILTVQPKIDQYKQLQGYMKLIAGQYICDSYETPEETVKAILINLERLRWMNTGGETYIHINIPSYQLFYHTPNTHKEFKVVVGKPATPTATLASAISYLETAPDWRIPNRIFINELLPKAIKDHSFFRNNHMAVYTQQENFIPINKSTLTQIKQNPKLYHAKQTTGCDNALGKVVFRFPNNYGIYLHDTPEQNYFAKTKRAFSHGCIRVEHAAELASLIMKNDSQYAQVPVLEKAMSNYVKQRFPLKKPIAIFITYLTITVEDQLLVTHEDNYGLDKALLKRIFGEPVELTKNQ